jgi:regulator of protease activity HflC (stomatin/prohibitin superfamily)
MTYLIFLGVLFLIGLFAWFLSFFFERGEEGQIISRIIGTIAVIASTLSLVFSTFTTISAGHVGVKVDRGSVKPDYLVEGFHMINPWYNIIEMSARTHTYTMSQKDEEGAVKGDDSIGVLSKNGMKITMDVSVPHRLVPATAPWVYKNLGVDYDYDIVRPAIATAVREAAANFSEDEIYSTKRGELVKIMKERLEEQIEKTIRSYGADAPETVIVFPEVQLRNVALPESVQTAINEKSATEQKIIVAQNEARRKKVEAEGIKAFQDIVSQGITPDLLKWKGIEATIELASSPNTKTIIIGGGQDKLPIILNGDNK